MNAFLAPYSLTPFDCSLCMLAYKSVPFRSPARLASIPKTVALSLHPNCSSGGQCKSNEPKVRPPKPLVLWKCTLLTTFSSCFSQARPVLLVNDAHVFRVFSQFTRSHLNSCQTVSTASFNLAPSTAHLLSILLTMAPSDFANFFWYVTY